jgi:hypothetical protein
MPCKVSFLLNVFGGGEFNHRFLAAACNMRDDMDSSITGCSILSKRCARV